MNNHKGVRIEVPWREEEDATSPGLELEVAMSHETCVLSAELGFFRWAGSVLNHRVLFPVPDHCFFIFFLI